MQYKIMKKNYKCPCGCVVVHHYDTGSPTVPKCWRCGKKMDEKEDQL